jgi:5-formyltetrahydrofolate cyclo-ligase
MSGFMKHILRREMLSQRNKQKGEVKLEKDAMIKEKLLSLNEYKKSKIILFYVSIRGEVKTEDMLSQALREGKRVLVPFVNVKKKLMLISEIHDLNELSPGAFGIPVPTHPKKFPLDKIDLMVVPGIAFDRKGNRVGYGTGFYDRFLKRLKRNVPVIALAYDFQIVPKIMPDKYDVRIHKIVTENEVISCRKR